MSLTKDENRLVSEQIKAYQNMIKFIKQQIKRLKKQKES